MLPNLDSMDIAVGVMCFDRPQYLERTINHLERCEDIGRVDWVFFQDGAVNKFSGERRADDADITKSRSLIENANLPNKEVRVNAHNMGNALQTDRCFRLLDKGYDAVIRLEDDVIVSKYFVRTIISMLTQFPDCMPTLYAEGSFDDRSIPQDLDKVTIGDEASFTVTAMSQHMFDGIRDRWDDFRLMAKGHDWIPHNRPNVIDEFGGGYANGCDGVLNAILKNHGYERLAPLVSRASHIGKEGVNMTPEQYDNKFGHGNEGDLEYNIDIDPVFWEVKHDMTPV